MKILPWFVRHLDEIVVLLAIVLYAAVFSKLSLLRHEAFASNYDLANMSQTVWNTMHGRFFALTGPDGTISRLSIHADLLLVLLAPLSVLGNVAEKLLIVQSVVIGLGAIPTFLLTKAVLAKTKLMPWSVRAAAVVMALVYLVNPAVEWANIYDFHAVTFAMPLLLATFYAAYTKHWRWYILFAALAILTKEEISLAVAMIGVFLAVFWHERKIGLITIAAGFAWFFVMVFAVIPHFSDTGKHWALNWYNFSDEAAGKTSAIPTPSQVIHKSFNWQARDYYWILLKSFGFLPILALPWLLLSGPDVGINVLSNHPQMESIMYHYVSGVIPGLVVASIFSLQYIVRTLQSYPKIGRFTRQIFICILALFLLVAVRVNYHYSPLPTTPSCWCIMYHVDADDKAFAQVLQTIPPNALITASSEIRAHLTERENAYTLPSATDSSEYIAILDQNRIVGDYSLKEYEASLLASLSHSTMYTLVVHIGHFYLYKRNS